MGKVFAYDSPVWKFMGRLIDFAYLTLLWAVTSLPVITIGASTTTVYYITLKMADNQEEYLTKMYFKNFVRFFKETTVVWLVVLAAGAVLAGDFYICLRIKSPAAVALMSAFAVLALVIFLCIAAVGVFGFWPLLLLAVGLTAYLQSLIFRQIFRQQGWEI